MTTLNELMGVDGGVPLWVSGTTYAQGNVRRSPTDWQNYVRTTDGAGATDPSTDTTNWRPDGARAFKPVQRGTFSGIAPSLTVTISAVNLAKAELRSSVGGSDITVEFTNATTLTVRRGAGAITGSYEISEWY